MAEASSKPARTGLLAYATTRVRPRPAVTLTSIDGREVTYRAWDSSKAPADAPVLVFVHGARERAELYGSVADRLAPAFSSIYVIDLRGHSPADISDAERRGRLGSRRLLLADLAALVTHARSEHPGRKLVLGGQSMGATLALGYAALTDSCSAEAKRLGPTADALLLTSPALALNGKGSWEGLRRSGGMRQLLRFRSGFPAGGLEDFTSGSAEYDTYRREDALPALSTNYAIVLAGMFAFWKWRYPRRVTQPTLIVSGTNDKLISPGSALALYQRLVNAATRNIITVEGAYHTVLFDDTTERTIALIAEWVDALGPESPKPALLGDYCVYRSDWWVRTVNSHQWPFASLLLMYLGIFFGLKVGAAALSGTLSSPTLLLDYATDAATLSLDWIHRAITAILPPQASQWIANVGAHSAYASADFAESGAVAVPLKRDYVDAIVTVLFAARMALLHGHWERLSRLPDRLWANGVVNSKVYRDADKREVLGRYDALANSRASQVVAGVMSAVIVAVMYWAVAFYQRGIYPTLHPAGSALDLGEWQRAAFDGWWANPAQHPIAFATHAAITLFVLYYTIRSNQVGGGLVGLLDEVRGRLGGFRPQPDHPDGYAGLRPARELLTYVFVTVAILGLAMAFLLFFLPYRLGWTILLPALLIAITASAVIIPRTVEGFHRILRKYRSQRLSELAERMRDVQTRITSLERVPAPERQTACCELELEMERLEIERNHLDSMQTQLFSRRGVMLVLGSYILPIITLIRQFMTQ